MASGTGRREATRMNANRSFVQKPWPLSRIARRMLTSFGRGLQGSERRIVLPRGLADGGTHHELEYLVLARPRCPRSGDVLVGDFGGVLCHRVDQHAQRLGEPCVIERGAALFV